jgi:predicted transcriptional regulator
MADENNGAEVLRLAATIVSAHVSNNPLAAADLPALIRTVYEALVIPEGTPPPQKPAVPIKKSVTPDYIVCLEDGSKHKMLKRHLRVVHEITPKEYREKWGLKDDYPMVAPAYARARSAIAKKIGLGKMTKRGKAKGKGKKA